MVRGDEHVARAWPAGNEPLERRSLDVTGEEQPPAGGFDGEHEARLVVDVASGTV